MGLSAVVYKSASALEKALPRYRFQREPISGECEIIHPVGAEVPWDAVKACDHRFGNIPHIGALRETTPNISAEDRPWSALSFIPAAILET